MTEKLKDVKIFYRTGGKINLKMKNVSFELRESVHLKLKIKCATLGVNIKDYLAELVLKDLEEDEKKEQN